LAFSSATDVRTVTIPADLVRRLRQARAARTLAAAEKALAGESIADDLTLLQAYEKLLELSRVPSRNNLIAAAIIGTACFLIAGFAWAVRIPSTKLHVTVVTDAVTFRLVEPWHWAGHWQLGDTIFRLDELSQLTLPPELSSQPELNGRAWLDVEKGAVALSELELGASGTIALLRTPPAAIHILSLSATLRGQAQISGTPIVAAGDAPSRQIALKAPHFEIPGTVSFYDAGRPRIPARLRLTAKDKITWRNIRVEKLSFSREEPGAVEGSFFVSEIKSGTVTLGDTGEKVELKEKDQLYLASLSGVIQEIELGPDSLRISFEGRAKKISVGVTGFEENLVPTWLSYLYRQERLGFFWGALVFLWGVLWSTRQLLFK
jgi:hypothetical protein